MIFNWSYLHSTTNRQSCLEWSYNENTRQLRFGVDIYKKVGSGSQHRLRVEQQRLVDERGVHRCLHERQHQRYIQESAEILEVQLEHSQRSKLFDYLLFNNTRMTTSNEQCFVFVADYCGSRCNHRGHQGAKWQGDRDRVSSCTGNKPRPNKQEAN